MIIDLDKKRSTEQQPLVSKFYRGYIPHVVVLNAFGNAAYNAAGEVSEAEISRILDGLLKEASR